MKVRGIFSFLVGAVLVQFALAKMPFTNDIFGKLEGTLDFCIQVDNSAAKKYDEKKKSLVKDVPEGEVAKARESDEMGIPLTQVDPISSMPVWWQKSIRGM